MRLVAVAAAALALLAAPLHAQDAHASPEALVMEGHRLVATKDWAALAALVERPALERVKHTFVRMLTMDPDAQVLAMFDVADLDAFRALAPIDVMTAVYNVALADMETMELRSTEILGVVHEAPDQAHVVVRQDAGIHGMFVSSVEMLSARRYEDGWWFQLNSDLEGFLIGIESQLPPEDE